MNSFQLSEDQRDAVDKICNKLANSNPKKHTIAVLTGSAGTGKTTVVGEIINRMYIYSPLTPVELCATTHRAAIVLKNITTQLSAHSTKDVQTGHSLFKLRPSATKTGKEVNKQTGKCNIEYGSTVIIDEASMIGNDFLTAIVDIVKDKALKVLFVGDPFQLPPPKDACSIFDGSFSTYKLTTVHRQTKDNPILSKADEFREYIQGIRKQEPVIETALNDKGEGIHILSHADFVTKFVKKYMSYSAGDPVDIPLCTYTNESAINYNTMVRKSAFFLEDTIKPFYKGERLISNSAVMDSERTILTNNETVHVDNYIEGIQHGIPGYYITVRGEPDKYTGSRKKKVFSPKNTTITNKIIGGWKQEAIESKSKLVWKEFYSMKNSLADLRPPFAGTTHKAQGGTFPAVFIDKININKCRDKATRARLFYVALTRASKNVYINS